MSARIRLVTANLLHERCHLDSLAELLDRHQPDVVAAQELGFEAARLLEARYPRHLLAPAGDFTGRGIATRFEGDFGEIEMPRRPGMWADLIVGEATVRVANVHLVNPIDFPWWSSVRTRGRQLQALFSWLDAAALPAVVAGDFNASPAWPAYRRVADRLVDVIDVHATGRGGRPEPTWGWRPGWPRMLRIDHVFATPGVSATEVTVEPVKGSDHWALVTTLEFPPPGDEGLGSV